jgi:hypothetical protein
MKQVSVPSPPRRQRRSAAWLPASVCAAALLPAAAAAQSAGASGAAHFLPVDHWSHAVVERLHALGAAPRDLDPGVRSRGAGEVASVCRHANALPAHPAGRRLGALCLARLEREFPGLPAWSAGEVPAWYSARLEVGASGVHGAVLSGIGNLHDDWTGPRPLDDHRSAAAGLRLGASIGRGLAGGARVAATNEGAEVSDLHAVARWLGLEVWGGRRSPGYGPGVSGGILLSGTHAFTGGGAGLAQGLRLPGVLRHLGPLRLEGFVSKAENRRQLPSGTDTVFTPWFAAARISATPFSPRLDVGVTRAAFFGGDGNTPVTLRNLLVMIYGDHSGEYGEFDNQMFGMDVHYRPPLGELPLLLRFEWGLDDNSGMLWRVPAVVLGAEIAALPGAEAVRIGVERTVFAGCFDCKNTRWYRNWSFREGWTDGGIGIGHPLGGHGREWMIFGNVDVASGGLHLAGDLRFRDRREENLFAPDRAGGSTAVAIRATWLPAGRLLVGAGGEHERGASGWSAGGFDVFGGWRF